MIKHIYILALAFASLTFISCQKDSGDGNQQPTAATALSQQNIAYGTDGMQKFDLYLPANRSTATTKSIILVHGGAWSQGDKSHFASYIDSIKARLPEYAIFNVNYRLANANGTNLFPVQELDVKAATEFIYNKRSEYFIADKFVMLGASAGGHLAMLQAFKNNSVVKPKAMVNFFGPSDMAALYTNPASGFAPPASVAALFGGATPTTDAAAYAASSPINYVTAQSAPTIIFQGGVDPLVRPAQQTALKAKLDAAGVTNEYVLYPGEGHGWLGANLSNSFERMQSFLQRYVQ